MCEWKVRLAAKIMGDGTWIVRWTGDDGEPLEIGPDTLENIREELISIGTTKETASGLANPLVLWLAWGRCLEPTVPQFY